MHVMLCAPQLRARAHAQTVPKLLQFASHLPSFHWLSMQARFGFCMLRSWHVAGQLRQKMRTPPASEQQARRRNDAEDGKVLSGRALYRTRRNWSEEMCDEGGRAAAWRATARAA